MTRPQALRRDGCERAALDITVVAGCDALECLVVECKYKVPQTVVGVMVVMRMNRVHSLQGAQPRGIPNLPDSIRREASRRQRMSREGLIVWWTEHVGVRSIKPNACHELIFRGGSNHVDVGATPIRISF